MSRRLFWKIFLPFWVAQALLLGALYLRVHYRINSEHPWWIQPERHQMPILADLAAKTFQEQGPTGLQQMLDNLSLTKRSRFWLVDTSGRELTNRPVPTNILHGAAAAEQNEGLYHSFEANVLAARATTPQGQYILIAELTPPALASACPAIFSGR